VLLPANPVKSSFLSWAWFGDVGMRVKSDLPVTRCSRMKTMITTNRQFTLHSRIILPSFTVDHSRNRPSRRTDVFSDDLTSSSGTCNGTRADGDCICLAVNRATALAHQHHANSSSSSIAPEMMYNYKPRPSSNFALGIIPSQCHRENWGNSIR